MSLEGLTILCLAKPLRATLGSKRIVHLLRLVTFRLQGNFADELGPEVFQSRNKKLIELLMPATGFASFATAKEKSRFTSDRHNPCTKSLLKLHQFILFAEMLPTEQTIHGHSLIYFFMEIIPNYNGKNT